MIADFSYINAAIAGAVVAVAAFLKTWLKDKKIGNFKLKRLLPIFVGIIAEILNIIYGLTTGENIVISVANGITSTFIAVFGYDVAKALFKEGDEEK